MRKNYGKRLYYCDDEMYKLMTCINYMETIISYEERLKRVDKMSIKSSFIQKSVDISMKYFKYVELYGFPVDGIFDPILLDTIHE